MKNKKRNPIVLLLCVIILLIFIIIILLMSNISSMRSARENAFRIESNNIISAAEKVYNDYKGGKYNILSNNANVCYNEEKICITIKKLNENKYYNNNKYKGKVEINIKDKENPTYTLYVTRSAEFRFVGLSYTNYTEYGQINNLPWMEEYELCSCESNLE